MSVVVIAVIAVLFAREFRSWERFEWRVAVREIAAIRVFWVLFGTLLFYAGYFLRAWRWKLLLIPVCGTTVGRMLAPTFIGFTALALLGRAGEFVRPYLIARKEQLPFSSQIAVWAVERVLDLGAFGAIVVSAAFSIDVRSFPYLGRIRNAAFMLLCIFAALVSLLLAAQARGRLLMRVAQGRTPKGANRLQSTLSNRLHSFAVGLKAISDKRILLGVIALSVLMWCVIAFAYDAILRAFPVPLRSMPVTYAAIVMGFSAMGALVQLPAAATSQLIVIAVLMNVFKVSSEIAVAAGITLWLAGYMVPVPIGLICLKAEHVSLLAASRQSRTSGPEA